jgi:hypothetical protein
MEQPLRKIQPIPIRFTKWIKGYPDVPSFGSSPDPKNMVTFRVLGDQFTGKSAFLEAVSSQYFANGSTVYDIFGANDNEMLAWLDSPFKDRVVLIHGNDMRIKCNVETVSIGELRPKNALGQRIYVTSRAFFRKRADDYHYYSALYQLTRRFRERDTFDRTDVICIREADEFVSSAKASGQGIHKAQIDAEMEFAKFHNQMVHYGYALVIDQHRDVDVAKKIRFLSTYLVFKNMGDIELPRPWWPLRYLDPDLLLRRLKPHQFAVKTNHQCIGVGTFDLPPWHIKRGSGLLAKFGISVIDTVTGSEMVEEVITGGGRQGIPLDESQKLQIRTLSQQGISNRQIARKLGVASSTVDNLLS